MAMAANAPNLRDAAGISVTPHALEKLRERLPAGSHFKAMPDKDLILRVEEAWKNAKRANAIEEWWENVENGDGRQKRTVCNFICDLEDSFEADLLGLFREDNRHPGRPTAVTVLTRPMVELNKATNKWARTPEKIGEGTLLGNGLGKQLAAIKVAPAPAPVPVQDLPIDDSRSPYHDKPGFRPGDPGGYPSAKTAAVPAAQKQAAPVAPPPRRAPTPVPVPAVVPPVAPAPTPDIIMITWLSATGSGERGCMPVPKEQVSGFVDQLVEAGVDASSVEFWVKREAKVRRTVVVEF